MEVECSGKCDFDGSGSKEKKIQDGSGELLQVTSDRISGLPDSLLIKILSFLDTKDAFKTGILSKWWENVWTDVENLVFNYEVEEYSREHVEKFISFVDYALLHCTRTNLKKFSLSMDYHCFCCEDSSFADDVVDKWLQYILKKNVECFELLIMTHTDYCPPESFYHKSSFVQLEVHYWEIEIIAQSVNWPSLKILKLDSVGIDEEQIAKILLGCPVLEDLSLCEVSPVTHLNIMSRSVKKLKISQRDGDLLDLNAPWLQELEISGNFFSIIPRFINVSSLITAKINLLHFWPYFSNDEDSLLNMACQVLDSIRHIKELTLSHLFIQAFSIKKRLGRPSPSFTCKHLTVECSTLEYNLPAIACLLQSSPNLENLTIEVKSISYCYFRRIFAELPDVDTSLFHLRGNTLPIKNAKLIFDSYIMCFREIIEGNKEMFPEIAVAEYLFSNAPFMRKLVISTRTEDCKKCVTNCASYYLSLLSSTFFRVCAEKNDKLEWQVRKTCSTLEISRM